MRVNGNGEHEPSAAEEIVAYSKRVDEGLKRFHTRTHYEATTEDTPLDAVLRAEESAKCPKCREIIELPAGLEEWGIRNDTAKRLFEYFCADGVNPADVLRRVYAMGNHLGIAPFSLLTTRERGLLLDDSHGAQHWRMAQICTNPIRRAGGRAWKAPGQKSLEARAVASECQQGNTNRKKTRKPSRNVAARRRRKRRKPTK